MLMAGQGGSVLNIDSGASRYAATLLDWVSDIAAGVGDDGEGRLARIRALVPPVHAGADRLTLTRLTVLTVELTEDLVTADGP